MGKQIVKTTIRVPKDLWVKVLVHSAEQDISAQEIVVIALRNYLKKGGSQ